MPSSTAARADLSLADLDLAKDLNRFYCDPLGFVLYVYPWGKEGTRLAKQTGPDEWQVKFLDDLGKAVAAGVSVADALPVMFAVAAGNGVGKSALISWIIHWFMSTRQHPQIVVTAGKKEQLQTKTWRELAKWNHLALMKHWFKWTATKLSHVLFPDTWNANAIAWSKQAADNFAGTHEENVLIIYDEASAIDDAIWEATDGAMTTPGAMWIAFGNPTRNGGRFAQCFGKFAALWNTRHVDSRTAKMANKRLFDAWIQLWGEDSDFVRVHVRGVFPRAGDIQFIANDVVTRAMKRQAEGYHDFGKVMSVDVARHGMDRSVICKRQGAKVLPFQKLRIPDLMQLAARIAEEIDAWKPDAVFIDATGIGWGVVDRLHQMGYTFVIGIQTGEKAYKPETFRDRRAELWYLMREFITDLGDLPEGDSELETELTSVEYGFDDSQRYVLESKRAIKEREGWSPDVADALALSFAAPVAPTKTQRDTWRNRLKRRKNRPSAMAA
ncbi:MAG: terminase [Proteobacteria bacterium]|nr:terminase [Pseudomonadota bacterium]